MTNSSRQQSHKVIFADRDGTINVDHGYVHRVEDWEFIPGSIDGLRTLREAGFKLAVVSNQAGIADGRFGESEVRQLHTYMSEALAIANAPLEAVAFCPHRAGCACRKPATGMAKIIEEQIGAINYGESWVIGDKPSDISFGENLGTRTALIRSRYWDHQSLQLRPQLIVDSLAEFASIITNPDAVLDRTNWRLHKIVSPARAAGIASLLRAGSKSIATTNGSFDLLHAGHLDQLEEARRQADVLFVGINCDEAIRQAKGSTRPYLGLDARAAILAALACVDYVVPMYGSYQEEPMKSLLETICPNIHVNGPDYGPKEAWAEWPTMKKLGVDGFTIKRRCDLSTSRIIRKIIASTQPI